MCDKFSLYVFIAQDWCDGPMKQLLEDKDKRNDSQAIKNCFQSMFQNLLDIKSKAESASQTRGNEFGPFRRRFAQVNNNNNDNNNNNNNYDYLLINISLLKYSTQIAIYTLKVYKKELSKTYLQFISIKKKKRDYFQAQFQ